MKALDITIRPFKPSDLNSVADLEKHIFGEKGYRKQEFMEFYEKEPDGFLVATNKNNLVGYILATITIRPEDILTVVIKPDFQRKGIGKKLLQKALLYLKKGGLKYAQVVIRNDNPIALNFFEKNKFKPIGLEDHYYQDGTAGIRLVRKF